MFLEYEDQIRAEAVEVYPEEGVWLITKAGCRLVENRHATPTTHFLVGRKDLGLAISEGLLAVVHSHPDGEDVPSAEDMQSQINNNVPFGVLVSGKEGSGKIRWWGMKERPPLLERPFVHGITDCYSLIRDYYHMELGIDLPEYPRSWLWWEEDESMFLSLFEKTGFYEIPRSEARGGDVFFSRINAKVVNHGGIILDNGLILHQIGSPGKAVDNSRLSAREPINRYIPFITGVYRHKDVE